MGVVALLFGQPTQLLREIGSTRPFLKVVVVSDIIALRWCHRMTMCMSGGDPSGRRGLTMGKIRWTRIDPDYLPEDR